LILCLIFWQLFCQTFVSSSHWHTIWISAHLTSREHPYMTILSWHVSR
jgi:hypothetical protein